jgi:branched-chain amino acid transport system permease protein
MQAERPGGLPHGRHRAAVIFSIIIGFACLRLGGAHVALLTFAVAEAMYLLIITDTECFYMEGVTCRNFTGRTRGLVNFGKFGISTAARLQICGLRQLFSCTGAPGTGDGGFDFCDSQPPLHGVRGLTRQYYLRRSARYRSVQVSAPGVCRVCVLHRSRGRCVCGLFHCDGRRYAQSGVVAAAVLMVIGGLGTVWGPIVGAATLTRLLGLGLILILFTIFGRPASSASLRLCGTRLALAATAPPHREHGSRAG